LKQPNFASRIFNNPLDEGFSAPSPAVARNFSIIFLRPFLVYFFTPPLSHVYSRPLIPTPFPVVIFPPPLSGLFFVCVMLSAVVPPPGPTLVLFEDFSCFKYLARALRPRNLAQILPKCCEDFPDLSSFLAVLFHGLSPPFLITFSGGGTGGHP